jgi:hypothetical protein
MLTEFVFKFLDRIGPVDQPGRLVVVSDVVAERRFQSGRTHKVIGLQVFALKHIEQLLELASFAGLQNHF